MTESEIWVEIWFQKKLDSYTDSNFRLKRQTASRHCLKLVLEGLSKDCHSYIAQLNFKERESDIYSTNLLGLDLFYSDCKTTSNPRIVEVPNGSRIHEDDRSVNTTKIPYWSWKLNVQNVCIVTGQQDKYHMYCFMSYLTKLLTML